MSHNASWISRLIRPDDGWRTYAVSASEPMVDDPDIFRAAKLIIDQHGEEAALRAAQRPDKLLEGGDLEASIVWRRVAAAIEELWRGRRNEETLQ